MASREDLERQLAELESAYRLGGLDQVSYEQGRAHLMRLLEQLRSSVDTTGSDFFATGGAAPPTASGVQLHVSMDAPQAPIQAGQVIRGRYRIDGMIGEGGMGIVYKVYDLLRHRTLAMKLLHPHFPAEAQEQLASELSMQERIRHKGVVQTYDLDVDPESGRFFYTMEFVDGPSLEEHLEKAKQMGKIPPFSIAETTELLNQLTDVLQTAHDEGIVHRDLKPANILLPRDGGVKLLDFGIAKELSESSQHTGYTGTPIYMAPEQLRGGGSVTAAADVYSVGVILYQLLTGQLFYGRMPGPSEWLQEQGITPDFPKAVDDVVFKALDFSPARRYASMAELNAAFTQALGLPGGSRMGSRTSVGPSTAKSWDEAARSAEDSDTSSSRLPSAGERPIPIEEPESSSTKHRRAPRIRGKAPVSIGDATGERTQDSAQDSRLPSRRSKRKKKEKKKKKFGIIKILLILFVGIPLGLIVIGVLVETFAPRRPVPPPKIDLAQVNQAFRTTIIPSSYGTLDSIYKKEKVWMYEFERAVNEIYLGPEIVSIEHRRKGSLSTIYGFIDKNKVPGYQAYSDQLLFRIVQTNSVTVSLGALRRLRSAFSLPAPRQRAGNWLDSPDDVDGKVADAQRLVRKKLLSASLTRLRAPMKYRIEDGEGWVYERDSLPYSAKFHMLARSFYLPSYVTFSARIPVLRKFRAMYRETNAYKLRKARFRSYVSRVRSRRRRYYRSHRRRSRYRSRYRSRSRRGGKW